MVVGELGDFAPERDGSLAVLVDGFFLEAMNEPLDCEDRHRKEADSRLQWWKLLMGKRNKF